MGFRSILSFAHALIQERVREGDTAIDATVGGGVDTLFLARVVGVKGRVYGFDVQQEALDAARRRLEAEPGTMGSVTLLLRSHDAMEAALPLESHGAVAAAMFNLGYLPPRFAPSLPYGNRAKSASAAEGGVITRASTTLPALDAALRLLCRGGVVTVAVYSGHEGGADEAAAVDAWAAALPPEAYEAVVYRFANRAATAPYLVAVEKK